MLLHEPVTEIINCEEILSQIELGLVTVWWRRASLTCDRFVAIGTVVSYRVFVAVPASNAALLITSTRAVLPLCVAPSTMVFVLALSVANRSRIGTFA